MWSGSTTVVSASSIRYNRVRMVSITSYLKQEGALVPVSEFRGPVEDEDYIEGALELTINYVPLLTTDYVDYIDQLWAYLIQGMANEVKSGQAFSTFFPDCPIQVTLRPESGQRLAIEVDLRQQKGPRSAAAPANEVKQAFAAAAREFLTVMIPLVPSRRGTYERLLALLDTL